MPFRSPPPVAPFVAPFVALAAAAALAGACGGGTDPATTPVARIALSDTAVALRQGDEAALVARPEQRNGDALVGRRLFWASRDPRVADVSQAGVIRAVGVGTTQVAASAEGLSAVATVTVLARPVATVQIEPATLQLTVNARQRLTARALNDAGAPAAAPVTWTTLTPDVVSVTADGVVTALQPGVGSVRATADSVSATVAVAVVPVPVARVTVSPAAPTVTAGGTVQLAAAPVDSAGSALPGRVVVWSSRDPSVAAVSSTGQVTGLTPGTATVVATVEGQTATATVTVRPVPVARVTVTPDGSSVGVGGTLRLGALVADSAGNALTGRTVAFASSAAGVARVAADGTVTGVAVGTATITATSEGVSGSATVRVVAPPTTVASVVVAPPAFTLTVGTTRTVTATPRTADGTPVTGRTVTWSSTAAGVATVNSAGLVSAVAPGTAQILALVDGITGTATVTVQRPPVATVQITPAAPSVPVGASVALGAAVRDSAGNALTGRVVTWASADERVAVVSSDGRVLGIAAGATTVRATSEGVTASAAVTVTAVVRVSPNAATVRDRGNPGGRTVQLTAVDQTGRPLPAAEVTWRSDNPAAASVDGTGLVRGLQSGTSGSTAVTITATFRGASGTAVVTVVRE